MAISPSISFKKISDSVSSTKRQTKETKNTTINLSKLLNKNISTKKNLSSNIRSIKQKRIERENRNVLRDRLAAPLIAVKPRGPRLLAASDRSTSITDRLLGFVGYLSAGWILSNLPTWISLGEQFSQRIVAAGTILSGYGDELVEVISSIGNVFSAGLVNISKFDFSDSSYLVRSSLNDLKLSIDELGEGIESAFGVLLQPFKELEKIPDAFGQLPSTIPGIPGTPPPSGTPGTGLPDPKSAEMYRIAAALSTEGSGSQSTVDMMQVVVNRKATGKYGATYTDILAAGESVNRSQFQGVWKRPGGPKAFRKIQTLEDAAKWSGQSKDSLLKIIRDIQNPTLQANSAKFVGGALEFRAQPGYYKKYGLVRGEMGSDGRFYNSAWRGGPGDNQFLKDPKKDPIRMEGAASFNLPKPQTSAPSPAQVLSQFGSSAAALLALLTGGAAGQRRLGKGDVFTKSLGRGVDSIIISDVVGSTRKGGRTHGGIDIAAPTGTYIALRVDCEVVAQGTYGNYGLLIDVWVPSLGIQLRMAHLSSVIIKSGKIPAGTSFARVGKSGRVTGPHIHLEYDTKKSSRGGGAINDDPNYAAKLDQYVRLLFLTNKPIGKGFAQPSQPLASMRPAGASIATQTAAEVDMEGQSYLAGVLEGVKQERTGRKVIVIDDRQPATQQVVVASGGSLDLDLSTDESFLVNNFMKNKLLSDLSYV